MISVTILTERMTAPYRGKYRSDSFRPIYDPPVFDGFHLEKYSHEFSNFTNIVIQIFWKASVMTMATPLWMYIFQVLVGLWRWDITGVGLWIEQEHFPQHFKNIQGLQVLLRAPIGSRSQMSDVSACHEIWPQWLVRVFWYWCRNYHMHTPLRGFDP